MVRSRSVTIKRCHRLHWFLAVAVFMLGWVQGLEAQSRPAGELLWAWHVTIAPAWFDPAEAPAQITPFGILYTLHDGLVRPMPGERMGNSLAESWAESPDGLTYEFKLRPGLRFHNGDPCTAEDVQFSFERYKGAGARELHANVQRVEVVDPLTVRFHLKAPWADFMTFYGTTATAAGLVPDRQAINESACLGYCPPAGVIIPRLMDYALPVEPMPHDPQKAKQLLAEAGYPRGFDAGEFVPIPPFFDVAEAVVNDLSAIGIRVRMRTMERAAFLSTWREKKLRGLFLTAVGASGNAATRIEAFIYSKGPYAYGGYPDIDELFQQQAIERDRTKREALLHRIQQLTVERVMFAPVMDLRALVGVGPRLAEHTINSIPLHPYPSFEDMRLKEP